MNMQIGYEISSIGFLTSASTEDLSKGEGPEQPYHGEKINEKKYKTAEVIKGEQWPRLERKIRFWVKERGRVDIDRSQLRVLTLDIVCLQSRAPTAVT